MQKTLFFILLAVFSACTNNAEKSDGTEKTEVPATSIRFAENQHNFGSLNAGEIVLYTFEFTNTGTHDYQISSVESDCGCTQIRHVKNAVKPGEKGWIEVEFDTSGLVGRELKTIEVRGNSNELKHLAIFAKVNNELLDIK